MTHIIVQNIFFCICIGCGKMGAFMWVPGFCHAGFHLELEIICIIEKFSKDSSYIARISSETS